VGVVITEDDPQWTLAIEPTTRFDMPNPWGSKLLANPQLD